MRTPNTASEPSSIRRGSSAEPKPLSFVRVGEELIPLSRVRTVPSPEGERTEFYGKGGRLLATTFQRNR